MNNSRNYNRKVHVRHSSEFPIKKYSVLNLIDLNKGNCSNGSLINTYINNYKKIINNTVREADFEDFGTFMQNLNVKSTREKGKINRNYKFEDLEKNKLEKSSINLKNPNKGGFGINNNILKKKMYIKAKSFDNFIFHKHKENFSKCQVGTIKSKLCIFYKSLILLKRDSSKKVKNNKQKISIKFIQRKLANNNNNNGNNAVKESPGLNNNNLQNNNNNGMAIHVTSGLNLTNLKLNTLSQVLNQNLQNSISKSNRSNVKKDIPITASINLHEKDVVNPNPNASINTPNLVNKHEASGNHRYQSQHNLNYYNASRHLKNSISNNFHTLKEQSTNVINRAITFNNSNSIVNVNKSINMNELGLNFANLASSSSNTIDKKNYQPISKIIDHFLLTKDKQTLETNTRSNSIISPTKNPKQSKHSNSIINKINCFPTKFGVDNTINNKTSEELTERFKFNYKGDTSLSSNNTYETGTIKSPYESNSIYDMKNSSAASIFMNLRKKTIENSSPSKKTNPISISSFSCINNLIKTPKKKEYENLRNSTSIHNYRNIYEATKPSSHFEVESPKNTENTKNSSQVVNKICLKVNKDEIAKKLENTKKISRSVTTGATKNIAVKSILYAPEENIGIIETNKTIDLSNTKILNESYFPSTPPRSNINVGIKNNNSQRTSILTKFIYNEKDEFSMNENRENSLIKITISPKRKEGSLINKNYHLHNFQNIINNNLSFISNTKSNNNLTNKTRNDDEIYKKTFVLNYENSNIQKDYENYENQQKSIEISKLKDEEDISYDECLFSSDEKIEMPNVPSFNIKKLETYNFASSVRKKTKKEVNKFLIIENFYTLLKYHMNIKETLLSFLNIRDVMNLSATSKVFKKETTYKINSFTINIIMQNNSYILRLKIWKSIYVHSELKKLKYLKKEYLDNLYKKSKYEDEIKKDLNRTFPEDPSFKMGKINYKKLFNILIAYSNYNPLMGYAQGLNFIVANAILVLNDEEEVFVFIDALVNKYDFNKLIGVNNQSLTVRLNELERLIKINVPQVINYLEENMLNHEFFTTNWIITIFSNSIKKPKLFKVWDLFLIYGWRFINGFIIAIVEVFKEKIIQQEASSLSNYMKNLLKSENFENSFEFIVNKAFENINQLEEYNK